MRATFLVMILPLAACASSAARASTPMRFSSVKVELPTGDRMYPGGNTANAINNDCLACHSAGMVLNQPALTKAQWTAEVHKMIDTYKAPVPPEDVDPIIAYLVQTKGSR